MASDHLGAVHSHLVRLCPASSASNSVTYKGWRDACSDYTDITGTLDCLYLLLRRLETHVPAHATSEPRFAQQEALRRDLATVIRGVRNTVNELDKVLDKFASLGKSRSRNWERIRFGVKDLSSLRSRLTQHVSSISAFLNVVELESIGRLDQSVNAMPDIISERVTIALGNFIDAIGADNMSVRGGTVMTSYSNDDIDVWRQFRSECVKSGIKSGDLKRFEPELRRFLTSIMDESKGGQNVTAQNETAWVEIAKRRLEDLDSDSVSVLSDSEDESPSWKQFRSELLQNRTSNGNGREFLPEAERGLDSLVYGNEPSPEAMSLDETMELHPSTGSGNVAAELSEETGIARKGKQREDKEAAGKAETMDDNNSTALLVNEIEIVTRDADKLPKASKTFTVLTNEVASLNTGVPDRPEKQYSDGAGRSDPESSSKSLTNPAVTDEEALPLTDPLNPDNSDFSGTSLRSSAEPVHETTPESPDSFRQDGLVDASNKSSKEEQSIFETEREPVTSSQTPPLESSATKPPKIGSPNLSPISTKSQEYYADVDYKEVPQRPYGSNAMPTHFVNVLNLDGTFDDSTWAWQQLSRPKSTGTEADTAPENDQGEGIFIATYDRTLRGQDGDLQATPQESAIDTSTTSVGDQDRATFNADLEGATNLDRSMKAQFDHESAAASAQNPTFTSAEWERYIIDRVLEKIALARRKGRTSVKLSDREMEMLERHRFRPQYTQRIGPPASRDAKHGSSSMDTLNDPLIESTSARALPRYSKTDRVPTDELRSKLSFKSQKSLEVDNDAFSSGDASIPTMPKPPTRPPMFPSGNMGQQTWCEYAGAFGDYVRAFTAFEASLLRRLEATNKQAQRHSSAGTNMNQDWLEKMCDGKGMSVAFVGWETYASRIQKGEEIRDVWRSGWESHSEAVRDFMAVSRSEITFGRNNDARPKLAPVR